MPGNLSVHDNTVVLLKISNEQKATSASVKHYAVILQHVAECNEFKPELHSHIYGLQNKDKF